MDKVLISQTAHYQSRLITEQPTLAMNDFGRNQIDHQAARVDVFFIVLAMANKGFVIRKMPKQD